jgi:hypothetical protein
MSDPGQSASPVFDVDPCYRGPARMTMDHNCIRVRRWVCVNCDRTFKVDTR